MLSEQHARIDHQKCLNMTDVACPGQITAVNTRLLLCKAIPYDLAVAGFLGFRWCMGMRALTIASSLTKRS